MSELITNEDYTLQASPDPVGSPWMPGTPAETRVTAPKAEAPDGKKILVQQILYTYILTPLPPPAPVTVACSFTGHTFVAGAGSITASAVKVKCSGLSVIRENDEGECIGSFTNNSSGAVVPCKCKLKIASAGQTKVKGA